MPKVLTTASSVLCGPAIPPNHGGQVSIKSIAKLKVTGNPVLLKESIANQPVPPGNCKTPSNSTKPCTSVQSVTTGEAMKLTVGGKSVMLESVSGATDGKPPGILSATANQDKLSAI